MDIKKKHVKGYIVEEDIVVEVHMEDIVEVEEDVHILELIVNVLKAEILVMVHMVDIVEI